MDCFLTDPFSSYNGVEFEGVEYNTRLRMIDKVSTKNEKMIYPLLSCFYLMTHGL